MLPFILDYIATHWRKFVIPMLALTLATVHFYVLASVKHYVDRSVEFSANRSLIDAELLVYNDELPGIDFLDAIDSLETVDQFYYPMTVWGHVIVDDRSTQIALRTTPPEGMQREQFHAGSYPQADDEIALPQRLANYLGVEVGDSLVIAFPSIGEAGVARSVTVTGLYAYSLLGDAFDNSLNAVIGMEMDEVWQSSTGRFPLVEDGVFIQTRDGVTVDEVTASVLAIPGTVAETREDRSARYTSEFATKAESLLEPLQGLYLLAIVGVTSVLMLAGLAFVRDRQSDLTLFSALGASPRKLFSWVMAEFIVLGLISIVVGLTLGQGVIGFVHQQIMSGPGSDFLPSSMSPYWTSVLVVSALALVLMTACAVVVAWASARLSQQPYEFRRHDVAITTSVMGMTVILIFTTALLVRQRYGVNDLLGSPRLVPAVVVAIAICATGLLARRLINNFSRRHSSVGVATIVTSSALRTREGVSLLTVMSCALLATLVSTDSAREEHFADLARSITPYDISIQAPDSARYSMSDDEVATMSNFANVASHLPVYSDSLTIVDDSSSDRRIFVYAIEPDQVRGYDTTLPDMQAGTILLPRDVLTYLGLEEGDALTLSGSKSQQVTFTIHETEFSWVFMTKADLDILSGLQGPSELWMTLADTSNSGLAFIDIRQQLIDAGLASDYRVASALTSDVISVVTDDPWGVPVVYVFLIVGLALSLIGLIATSFDGTCSQSLASALGANRRRILRATIAVTVTRVMLDAGLGVLIGAGICVAWDAIGLFGTSVATIPVGKLALIVVSCVAGAACLAIGENIHRSLRNV